MQPSGNNMRTVRENSARGKHEKHTLSQKKHTRNPLRRGREMKGKTFPFKVCWFFFFNLSFQGPFKEKTSLSAERTLGFITWCIMIYQLADKDKPHIYSSAGPRKHPLKYMIDRGVQISLNTPTDAEKFNIGFKRNRAHAPEFNGQSN